MVNQAIVGAGPASTDCLLHGIEHDAGRGTGADLPAGDAPNKRFDDEGNLDESGPSVVIGEMDDPDRVRACHVELAVRHGFQSLAWPHSK